MRSRLGQARAGWRRAGCRPAGRAGCARRRRRAPSSARRRGPGSGAAARPAPARWPAGRSTRGRRPASCPSRSGRRPGRCGRRRSPPRRPPARRSGAVNEASNHAWVAAENASSPGRRHPVISPTAPTDVGSPPGADHPEAPAPGDVAVGVARGSSGTVLASVSSTMSSSSIRGGSAAKRRSRRRRWRRRAVLVLGHAPSVPPAAGRCRTNRVEGCRRAGLGSITVPERTHGPGPRPGEALRRLHRGRRHRRRGRARRGVRLPRPQRRRQVLHDADDRLRLAGHRRARCGCSGIDPAVDGAADPGPARRRAAGGHPRRRADGAGEPAGLRPLLRAVAAGGRPSAADRAARVRPARRARRPARSSRCPAA